MLQVIHGCDFSDWILERMPVKNGKPKWYYTIGIGNEKKLLGGVILFDTTELTSILAVLVTEVLSIG